jgi:hypothetical protein
LHPPAATPQRLTARLYGLWGYGSFGRVGAGRLARVSGVSRRAYSPSSQVSRLPPPNPACDFHRTGLSRDRHSSPGITPRVVTHSAFPFLASDFTAAPGSCLVGRQSPGALRPVTGFPGLRLLWRLRRCPGFTAPTAGAPFQGQPPAFTSMDSTESFRWWVFIDLTALCGSRTPTG